MFGVPKPTLLNYGPVVDVNMNVINQINLADVNDYGHRVIIELDTATCNQYFNWERLVNTARPRAKLNASQESTFRAELIAAFNGKYQGYYDIDGVNGGLHFSSEYLSMNLDPRIRKNGTISANDIPMAFILYKTYGNSWTETLNEVFNLQDAYDMLTSETLADALINSFKTEESGAVDNMFRDLLAHDPIRFFDIYGHSDGNLFEINLDAQGNGTWKLMDGDRIEIRIKFVFHSEVTRRGVGGHEFNITEVDPNNSEEAREIIIHPENYFYLRLQFLMIDGSSFNNGGTIPGGE